MSDTQPTATYEGKAKRLKPHDTGSFAMEFKDDATAFNGVKHEVFPGKGDINAEISAILFEELTKEDVPNHFLRRLSEDTLEVGELAIVPVEVVVRFVVTGSLAKRTGLPTGAICEPPVVEFYYKNDALGDPMINPHHARLLGFSNAAELEMLENQGVRIAELLKKRFARAGMALWDIKFEFGRDIDERLVLGDEISPDTCRLVDEETGEILDKDRFRFDKGDLLTGYRKVLDRLRKSV